MAEGRGRFSGIGNLSGLHAPSPRPPLRTGWEGFRSPRPRPAEPEAATPAPAAAPPYLRPQVYARGPPAPGRASGEGREGGPLLPPTRTLPSPGRLRSRHRRCPLLQCESRRRRAGPGPGRPGNRDSTWRGTARRRAHPLSGPLPGAAPPAQPRRGTAEAGGCVAAVTRYAGPPPGTRVAAGERLDSLVEAGEGLRLGVRPSVPFQGRLQASTPNDLAYGSGEESGPSPDPPPSELTASPHQGLRGAP